MGLLRELFKPLINRYKGHIGERKVTRALNPIIFGRVEHKLINDLIIVDENGKSHQIDHIEIRHNGIFCIETKNYIGWIFGDENREMWTQTLYNGQKNTFYNPLKQNNSHIYHISKLIGKKYKINSLVVMAQNNSSRIDSNKVIDLYDLKRYLRIYDDGTYLSSEEMQEIYDKLIASAVPISNSSHVRNIRNTQKQIDQGICPRCGGRLVERNGKYGTFIGCSNYPKCKFILRH